MLSNGSFWHRFARLALAVLGIYIVNVIVIGIGLFTLFKWAAASMPLLKTVVLAQGVVIVVSFVTWFVGTHLAIAFSQCRPMHWAIACLAVQGALTILDVHKSGSPAAMIHLAVESSLISNAFVLARVWVPLIGTILGALASRPLVSRAAEA